jgi:hypothetical protein
VHRQGRPGKKRREEKHADELRAHQLCAKPLHRAVAVSIAGRTDLRYHAFMVADSRKNRNL